KPQMIAEQLFEVLRILNSFEIKSDRISAECGLYALHPDFPGLAESESLRQDPIQRVEFLEKRFAEDIGDARFIPYLQLHEYEAYLFSDPTCFKYLDTGRTKEIKVLQSIANEYQTPEFINDGLQTAPSKRIITQFPDCGKAKSVFGSQLAEQIRRRLR
ncbi:MAG: DUF4276 family protein, partial [Microcoleus sp. PH2017_10_PVI_O_A]|uniref:DUF4276 family protein n=1 Tax=unclassified Microcoleus TaxID=2642155 RepID=UPI001D7863C7